MPIGGLITIDKEDLPMRYQPLHGIVNQLADNSLDSEGEQAFEKAVEIADNDDYDPSTFELTGDSEGIPDDVSGPLRGIDMLNPYDPDDPGDTLSMTEVFDAVDMIEMINEIRYSK